MLRSLKVKGMAWDKKGKGHHTAIAAEREFTTFLNNDGHKNFQWEGKFLRAKHKGGTKDTADVIAITTEAKLPFRLS